MSKLNLADLKDPVRSIDQELLSRLEMVSSHVTPLPGGSGRRLTPGVDARLTGLAGVTPVGDTITYYEHFASVRDNKSGQFYVAFRETADALFARSQDPDKFPEWLMKTNEKLNERQIFIHQVYRHPKDVPVLRSQEDWLTPIKEASTFDTIVYFLGKNNVITAAQSQSYR